MSFRNGLLGSKGTGQLSTLILPLAAGVVAELAAVLLESDVKGAAPNGSARFSVLDAGGVTVPLRPHIVTAQVSGQLAVTSKGTTIR